MTPEIFHGSGSVVVDICDQHGIWFDAEELRKGKSSISQHRWGHTSGWARWSRGFAWDMDWDFHFRRGWRRHPLYWVLRIALEILEELLD